MSSASILLKKGKKEIEKGTYETRKFQVSTIKSKISNASDDHVISINKKIEDMGDKLADSVKGISAVSNLISEMSSKKEKSWTKDSFLNAYNVELKGEISDCSAKISSLETTISSLNSDYQNALNDEREAAKRALETAKRLVTK